MESVKLFIYLNQIANLECDTDLNKIIYNDLYLETFFHAQNLPIETYNLLDYIRKTKT